MDFAASRKANELYASFVSQVAMPGITEPYPGLSRRYRRIDDQERFRLGSENRARILAEWARRYDGKAAKKN